MNNFLPEGYEPQKSSNNYMKLQEGENIIRILSRPILGWLDWIEEEVEEGGKKTIVKKPVRTPIAEPKPIPFKADRPVREFWAMIIWDYDDKAVKILEITQTSIKDAIYTLHCDSDWGDPLEYDLNINRKGKELETKYSVMPKPKSELAEQISIIFEEVNPNLEELFTGGDPFAKNEGENSSQATTEPVGEPKMTATQKKLAGSERFSGKEEIPEDTTPIKDLPF